MNPWHVVDGECFKKKFGTEFSAIRFAGSIGAPRYVYTCPVCKCFHLSSHPHVPNKQKQYDLLPVKLVSQDAEYWLDKISKKHRVNRKRNIHPKIKHKNLKEQ